MDIPSLHESREGLCRGVTPRTGLSSLLQGDIRVSGDVESSRLVRDEYYFPRQWEGERE